MPLNSRNLCHQLLIWFKAQYYVDLDHIHAFQFFNPSTIFSAKPPRYQYETLTALLLLCSRSFNSDSSSLNKSDFHIPGFWSEFSAHDHLLTNTWYIFSWMLNDSSALNYGYWLQSYWSASLWLWSQPTYRGLLGPPSLEWGSDPLWYHC